MMKINISTSEISGDIEDVISKEGVVEVSEIKPTMNE